MMKINVKGVIVPNDEKAVYDYFGMDSTSPKDVSDALNSANGFPVDVDINSGGGSVFAGSEIYTALRSYKGGINIHVVGVAASAASVVAMAGPSDMSPTANMMVHLASLGTEGNRHAHDKTSEALQNVDKTIAAAYVAKSGMSEDDALAMMDKETWLTAQQAVDKGLIDKVMFADSPQLAAAYGNSMLPKSVINKIRSQIKNPQAETQADFLQTKLNLLKVKVY